jgi:polysaccharide biosynthesis/export protein
MNRSIFRRDDVRPRSSATIFYALVLLLVTGMRPALGEMSYRFGPGDVLNLSVFGKKDLSGRFRVNAEGKISYPALGEIAVANMTGPEMEQKVGQLLSDQMPSAGRVTVDVAEYAPIFILGDVEKPGRYEFHPAIIPLELLALAGGLKSSLLGLGSTGDPLLQIISLEQQLSDLRLVRYGEAATRARLLAEIDGRKYDGIVEPAEDQPIGLADKNRILHDEQALFDVRAQVLTDREQALTEQRDSYSQEVNSLTQSLKLRNEDLILAVQELGTAKGLLDRGLSTEPRVLDLRRQVSGTKRDTLEMQSFLARARERELAVDLQINELHSTRANELHQALRDLDLAIAQTETKLVATSKTLTELRSAVGRPASEEPDVIKFEVVRPAGGEYRNVEVAERSVLQPRDILRVYRQLAHPKDAATAQNAASTTMAARDRPANR